MFPGVGTFYQTSPVRTVHKYIYVQLLKTKKSSRKDYNKYYLNRVKIRKAFIMKKWNYS